MAGEASGFAYLSGSSDATGSAYLESSPSSSYDATGGAEIQQSGRTIGSEARAILVNRLEAIKQAGLESSLAAQLSIQAEIEAYYMGYDASIGKHLVKTAMAGIMPADAISNGNFVPGQRVCYSRGTVTGL